MVRNSRSLPLPLATGLLALGCFLPAVLAGSKQESEPADPHRDARADLERVQQAEGLVRSERTAILLGEWVEARTRGEDR